MPALKSVIHRKIFLPDYDWRLPFFHGSSRSGLPRSPLSQRRGTGRDGKNCRQKPFLSGRGADHGVLSSSGALSAGGCRLDFSATVDVPPVADAAEALGLSQWDDRSSETAAARGGALEALEIAFPGRRRRGFQSDGSSAIAAVLGSRLLPDPGACHEKERAGGFFRARGRNGFDFLLLRVRGRVESTLL